MGKLDGNFLGDPAGKFIHRVFADSAPVLEVELATQSGLGWRGKHTLLLSREAGSMFFLGEIYCSLPLPPDIPVSDHCGTCSACIAACPTGAIVAPYRLDARRCISYLTIELKGSIPLDLRPLIGNRVYGCDDCQLCCPWNRNAPHTREDDFAVRHGLDTLRLSELFSWSAEEFRERMAGSAIYRIGHERWLRNLAVGLGNAPATPEVIAALRSRREDARRWCANMAWALTDTDCNTPGSWPAASDRRTIRSRTGIRPRGPRPASSIASRLWHVTNPHCATLRASCPARARTR